MQKLKPILLVVCLFLVNTIYAQKAQNQVKKPVVVSPKQIINPTARVIRVYGNSKPFDLLRRLPASDSLSAKVVDFIQIIIANPKVLIANRPTDKSRLLLYVNQVPLKSFMSDELTLLKKEDLDKFYIPDKLSVVFKVAKDDGSNQTWEYLYKTAGFMNESLQADISVGWEGMYPIESDVKNFKIILYNKSSAYICLAIYALLIIGFIIFAAYSDIIREPADGNRGAFSLSQTQLAFWTLLIVGGYIYILFLTGNNDPLNPSLLILLGISIGTTAGSKAVNKYKVRKIADPEAKDPRGFFYDLLADGKSLSMHRFQICAWNLVLGIYFVYHTLSNQSLPEFSSTMLTLLGISSIAYLGLKVPEHTPSKSDEESTSESKAPVPAAKKAATDTEEATETESEEQPEPAFG